MMYRPIHVICDNVSERFVYYNILLIHISNVIIYHICTVISLQGRIYGGGGRLRGIQLPEIKKNAII